MGENMNIPLLILAAFMALIPLSSVAADGEIHGCFLNEVEEYDELIEGTGSGDTIDCSNSSTRHDIYGYGGDDILTGSEYDDFIAGGSGKDTIHGGDGDDAIDGGGDDDTIYGDDGDDILFGGVGSSPASGVGCALKTAFVAAGSSYLTKGGSGDDTIYGGDGDDCINAGSGEDVVYGGNDNDTLVGGNHSDLLDGGRGYDYIDGGWHTDTCVDPVDPVDPDDVDMYFNCEIYADSAPICGDGLCDANESDCSCEEDCGTPEESESICTDGEDNDCDGDIDCEDSVDCDSDPACIIPCSDFGSSCSSNLDCCSNKCKGKPGSKTCK